MATYYNCLFYDSAPTGWATNSTVSIRDDWDMFVEKIVRTNPEEIREALDIPGRSPMYPCDSVFGYPVYGNRKVEIDLVSDESFGNRESRYMEITSELHGKHKYVVFEDLKNWAFYGRCYVGERSDEDGVLRVHITMDCIPYRISTSQSSSATNVTNSTSSVSVNCSTDMMLMSVTSQSANTYSVSVDGVVIGTLGANGSLPLKNDFFMRSGNHTMKFTYKSGGSSTSKAISIVRRQVAV